MDRHKNLLNSLCRLCSKTRVSSDRNPVPKERFSRDIKLMFDVDVSTDVYGIHPLYICDCCRAKVQRWRNKRNKKQSTSININIAQYMPHTEAGCEICEDVTATADHSVLIEKGILLGLMAQLVHGQAIFMTLNNAHPVIKLIIDQNYNWNLTVFDKKANDKIKDYPEKLNKISAISLLTFVSNINCCFGLSGFDELCRKRSPLNPAKFTNLSGNVIALEEQRNGDGTSVCHINCTLILKNEKKLCDVCTMYRSTLMSMKSNLSKKKSTDGLSSHARHDKMNSEQLTKKLSLAVIANKGLKRKLKSLKALVSESFKNEGEVIQDDMSDSIEEVMRSCSTNPFAEGSAQQLLWNQQLEANAVHKTRRRWHPAIIRFCLSVHTKSPAAYRTIRNSGYLTLPHENTLKDYTQFTNANSGFNIDVLNRIMKDIHFEDIPPFRKIVTVGFDEMKIKSGLVYSKNTGNLVGFVDMGSMANSMEQYATKINAKCNDESPVEEAKVATHILSVMVRGMFSPLHETFAHFPTTGYSSYSVYWTIWSSISWLEYCGFDVRAIVCDGASANRKFFRQHGEKTDDIVFHTINPFSKKTVYFMSDVPHLMKTTRNNFENSGFGKKTRNLHYNKQDIRWSQLLTLVEEDLGVGSGLRKLHKLKHEHLYLTPTLRMKVKLAVQVLSNSVAKAFELQGKHDTKSVTEFVANMNKFFDCLNVTKVQRRKNYTNENQKEYRSVDDPRFKWLEDEFLGYLKRWEDQCHAAPNMTRTQRSRMCLSTETLVGLRISTKSFISLARELLTAPGIDYILSEKLNQDPLEEYFSKQRGCGGRNENPTVKEFQHNALTLQVAGSCILPSVRGNTTRNAKYLVDASPLQRRTRKKVQY